MMQFTEEQRAAEIEQAKELLNHLGFWGHASGFDAEFLIRVTDAYLAALESKPLGYIHKHAWHEYKQAVCTGGEDGHEMYSCSASHFAVYTFPPVAALRLPNEPADLNKIDAVYKAMVAAAPEMENAK